MNYQITKHKFMNSKVIDYIFLHIIYLMNMMYCNFIIVGTLILYYVFYYS